METNYGAEAWRAPTLKDGDSILVDECGRVVERGTYGHSSNYGVDYRSHWFRLVQQKNAGVFLLVKHGGGEERRHFDYSAVETMLFFKGLDSTERYLLLHKFYDIEKDARRAAEDRVRAEWAQAFVDKRIKKQRRKGAVYVTITPKAATLQAAA